MGHVIRELNFEGRAGLTFGASATEDLNIEYNLGGWKIKMLGKAYRKIVSRYNLANRGQFRVSLRTSPDAKRFSRSKETVSLTREWPIVTRSKNSGPRTNRCTLPTNPARLGGPDSSP